MKYYLCVLSFFISSLIYSQNNLKDASDEILRSHVLNESGPGVTIGIVKNYELIYQGSRGCMNLEYKLSYNDSTLFDLASVTKQFTSACIGILQKQKRLSINDDVRKYIPEMTQYGDTIRIKHLLNHTSGIRNHNVLLNLKGFDYQHQGYTNKMIQELMFKQKGVNNLPGEIMLYSNTNYVLLALVIERITRMTLPDFAKQALFDPLKMNNTFYKSNLEDIVENSAYPYFKNLDKYQQPKSLTLCIGAGGVVSSVKDLAKWSEVLLDPNHKFYFLKEFITELDTLNNGDPMKHARGMFVSPYKGYSTINHSGRDVGMRSQFICVPEENLAIIVFTNSEHINATNISYEILDLFLEREDSEKNNIKQFQHSADQLEGFTGIYQELNSDLRMEIVLQNDTLQAISSFGRNATPLISQTYNSLSRIDNPSVLYKFRTGMNSGAKADLEVDFGGAIFYFERILLDSLPNENLIDYEGEYYSEELNVEYSISLANNQLVLNFSNNENIILKEGESDVFGSNRRTRYSFIRNEEGRVNAFELASEGTVKEILFKKTNK